ncbi:MAG: serine/threonine protein kinase, partial [Candidatus Riflebacteria bacterium]|nr:serine/threonine protein kinase [Candidatus Riflebacteria bacterium]
MESLVGSTLGDYRLLGVLGRGGMGWVFRADQISLGRSVAVKVIRPEFLDRTDLKVRFRREMLALARLSHPNVVKVFEAGECDGLA